MMRMAETLREDPAILRDVALFHTVSFRGAGKAERTQEGREILDTMHTLLEGDPSLSFQDTVGIIRKGFPEESRDAYESALRAIQDGIEKDYQDYQKFQKRQEEPTMSEEQKPVEQHNAQVKDANALRKETLEHFKELVKEGKAVWQIAQAEKAKDPEHYIPRQAPVNPFTPKGARYYESYNALILMQAAEERGIKDPRWATQYHVRKTEDMNFRRGSKAVKTFHFDPEKKEVSTTNLFNCAELYGKAIPSGIEVYHKDKAQLGDLMLQNLHVDEKNIEDLPKLAKEAYHKAVEIQKQAIEEKKAEKYAPYMEEFNKRLETIKAIDLSKKPSTNDKKRFIQTMAKYYQADPSRKDYVIKAAKDFTKAGCDEQTLTGLISKAAPEAAKDPAKKGTYAHFVSNMIAKDKTFQKELADAKAQQAAR